MPDFGNTAPVHNTTTTRGAHCLMLTAAKHKPKRQTSEKQQKRASRTEALALSLQVRPLFFLAISRLAYAKPCQNSRNGLGRCINAQSPGKGSDVVGRRAEGLAEVLGCKGKGKRQYQ